VQWVPQHGGPGFRGVRGHVYKSGGESIGVGFNKVVVSHDFVFGANFIMAVNPDVFKADFF
jgi:hypothetical protein